ncbi:MAG: FAD-binding oxidoreductase [Rubrobacteraceae bacterium]|nr:FAD-binding oxidoreductase [Rubrobacteraceae bacterium]
MVDLHEGAIGAIEEVFGDRLKRRQLGRPAPDGALASVFPTSADEVALLARLADRYSVPLAALGAETAPEKPAKEGRILVRFDLMRGLWLSDEPWAEAEPGALWLELDNDLRVRGQGLTVYPTSAPRATVGGWLAQDGVGVGSFEYGWLSENVVSADVVMPGGGRRTVGSDELRSIIGPESGGAMVVGARLRTRRADDDVPYALAFEDCEKLAAAVADVFRKGVPLWHLGFLSPEMARIRGLGEEYLLFGAYPGERGAGVEKELRGIASSVDGRLLPSADAYRAWGERFFPIAPSRPTPILSDRTFIPVTEIPVVLKGHAKKAVQGTVARSGEVLLLAFDPGAVTRA